MENKMEATILGLGFKVRMGVYGELIFCAQSHILST